MTHDLSPIPWERQRRSGVAISASVERGRTQNLNYSGGMQPKILVVDDEPDIIDIAKFCLQRAGYAVITADNGESGLQCAVAEQPDAVILDVMMPIMDGFEVLKRLKEQPATAHIPVLMLSARDRYADLAKGQKYGCDFYCTKPFTPSELLSLVRRLLSVGGR